MAKKFKTYEEAVSHLDEVDKSDFGQLSLARKKDGWTVAHVLATKGELPEKFTDPEIIRVRDKGGWTVAHVLASRDKLPEKLITSEILKLTKTNDGWTVAHELAFSGKFPERFMTPDNLLLKTNNNSYVYEKLPKYENLSLSSAKDTLGLYLIATTKYRHNKISFDKFKELVNSYGLEKMKQLVKLTGKEND